MAFPIKIKEGKVVPTFEEIWIREGFQRSQGSVYEGLNTVGTTSVGNIIPNFNKSLRAVSIESTINSNATVRLTGASGGDDSGFYASPFIDALIFPGSSIQFKRLGPCGPNSLGLSLFAGDGTTPVKIGTYSTFILVTNDMNYEADHTIGWIGDSISEPTVNTDLIISDFHHFGVRDWLIENSPKKETFRIAITAQGGRTAVNWVSLLNSGSGGSKPYNLSIDFFQMGVNDSSQSTVPIYKASLKKWLTHRRLNYPGIVLVCLGASPMQGTAKQTLVDGFRLATAEAVLEEKALYTSLGLNPEKIIGIDLANSFDRSNHLNYATTDNPTNGGITGVHPGTISANGWMRTKITEGMDYNTSVGNLGINFPTTENPGGLLPAGGLKQRNIFSLLREV